jgi:hypothetical protein
LITCNFSGNLGNSLLQYLITRTVADKLNYEFGFNPKFNYDYHNGYNQLDFLDLSYGKIHNASFHEMPEGIINIWQEKHDHFETHDYYYYQPDIFGIKDNTKLIVPCGQDAKYYNLEKSRQWLKIKEEKIVGYNQILVNNNILLDENLCIINVRGGFEYLHLPKVLLRKEEYWQNAISHMKNMNPNMRFVIISDDIEYSKLLFPEFDCYHFSVGCDYFIINSARNLIISNSSFGLLPSWTNIYDPFIIAPKFWAAHNNNINPMYWASSNIESFKFHFLDREGNLS